MFAAAAATADTVHRADPCPGEHMVPLTPSTPGGSWRPELRQPHVPSAFCGCGFAQPENWKPGSFSGHLETSQATSCKHPVHHQLCGPRARTCPGVLAQRPSGSQVLPNCLPGALIPQAAGSVPLQSPSSIVALDPTRKGKGKPPNVFLVDVKPGDQAALYRHKCKSSSKDLGTEFLADPPPFPYWRDTLCVLSLWPLVHHHGQPQGALLSTFPGEGNPPAVC